MRLTNVDVDELGKNPGDYATSQICTIRIHFLNVKLITNMFTMPESVACSFNSKFCAFPSNVINWHYLKTTWHWNRTMHEANQYSELPENNNYYWYTSEPNSYDSVFVLFRNGIIASERFCSFVCVSSIILSEK